jgi:hypothetical protein
MEQSSVCVTSPFLLSRCYLAVWKEAFQWRQKTGQGRTCKYINTSLLLREGGEQHEIQLGPQKAMSLMVLTLGWNLGTRRIFVAFEWNVSHLSAVVSMELETHMSVPIFVLISYIKCVIYKKECMLFQTE